MSEEECHTIEEFKKMHKEHMRKFMEVFWSLDLITTPDNMQGIFEVKTEDNEPSR